jgi:hypothetical protein
MTMLRQLNGTRKYLAFKVSEDQFDEIFGRIKENNIVYGSGPYELEDAKINERYGGRGVYFRDENAHILEILTNIHF